ncbi:MAG: 30S ribosomal protein S4e [Candidatus Aenigmarchaeota archaeon]|nr:30S ribosomal protein S4e [Candidatus Aenigmarchaeota archaeon]
MPHLKRLLAPPFWKVSRKESKWVVAPRAGPHPKRQSIPLSIMLTSILKAVDTTTEAKKVVRRGDVLVDDKRRKDYGYPVGLFDVVTIPKMKKSYRLIPSKKGLNVVEISENEAKTKLCKIRGKTAVKGGKVQLNLHDGKNILVQDVNYNTGDSLLVELPKLKIVEHIPLQAGNTGIVLKGTTAGKLAKVKQLLKGGMREQPKIVCDIGNEDKTVTKENLFIVGKDKPLITVG